MSTRPHFPCRSLPDDQSSCKLLGLYPQRHEGLWMQRVKIQGGVLSAEQWEALAEMCARHTPSTPLHLTTRQNIEFHHVSPERVPHLQADIARAQLTGLGACGDTLRTITMCPGNGLCRDAPDVTALASTVRRVLEQHPDIYSLPRKFKISFSSCPTACAQPWINDLGFVAHRENGGLSFTAIGAGSLGPRPATGIILWKDMTPGDVVALVLAAVRIFHVHGDRKVRGKARLRHVRERLGDLRFLAVLEKEYEACLAAARRVPEVTVPEQHYDHAGVLTVPCGALSPDQARAIARLVREAGCIARLQNHHRISLFARNPKETLAAAGADPALQALLTGQDIVCCPGAAYCRQAQVQTQTVERQLRAALPQDYTRAIRISGCPNNCAQSGVADIGLIGRTRKDESGARVEGFRLLEGGGMGCTSALAEPRVAFLPSDQVAEFVAGMV